MTARPTADPAGDPITLLFPELPMELDTTRGLLALVPWERADWQPHPRSMSLRQLATHVAQLPSFLTVMASTDTLEFKPEDFAPPQLSSTDELLALFDAEVTRMHAALVAMDWDRLNGSWKMEIGGQAVIDNQRAMLLRHMGVNHMVHHRAQLGVFLRLLDVKIPGSYGPSADMP